MLVYFILCFGMIGPLLAQEEDRPPVIDAGNIERLGSVGRIEFDPQQTDQDVIYQNGRFALRMDGERTALSDIQGNISILNAHGLLVDSYGVAGADGLIANPQAITFGSNEQVASIHTDGESFYLAQLDYHSGEYQVSASDRPLFDLWFKDSAIYVEAEDYVGVLEKGNATFLSDGFHADTESIIRIGRIEPPLAVTVTEDGRVKRWNMEKGEVTAEVRVEGALPIYGQLNAGGDGYLVWRDPQSLALHVLDFETGADQIVVTLDGVYIPFIFLTAQADVIIGVDLDDAPVVVAWDVSTGTRYELGEYRTCNRPPDMVRLSQDGTTLVIGCDTGLDIWRIQ